MIPCHRRLLPFVLSVLILVPSFVFAQTVVPLGEARSGAFLDVAFFNDVAGTPLDGRQISGEFVFADKQSVEVVSGSTEGNVFKITLSFVGTHNSGVVGEPQFSGWIEDRFGNRTDGVIFNRGAGGNLFGYILTFETEEAATEISRIQFTVILPTVEGETLTDTSYLTFEPNEGGEVVVRAQTVDGEVVSFGAVKALLAN